MRHAHPLWSRTGDPAMKASISCLMAVAYYWAAHIDPSLSGEDLWITSCRVLLTDVNISLSSRWTKVFAGALFDFGRFWSERFLRTLDGFLWRKVNADWLRWPDCEPKRRRNLSESVSDLRSSARLPRRPNTPHNGRFQNLQRENKRLWRNKSSFCVVPIWIAVQSWQCSAMRIWVRVCCGGLDWLAFVLDGNLVFDLPITQISSATANLRIIKPVENYPMAEEA